jgi:hypothetical protein
MRLEIVEQAFNELLELGLEPSMRKLRERIGYGSMSDIQRFLSQIREERSQEVVASGSLPPDVRVKAERFLLQLWSTMTEVADDRVTRTTKDAERRIEELRSSLSATLVEADQMQLDIDQLRNDLDACRDRLSQEQNALSTREKELATSRLAQLAAERRAAGLQRSLDLHISGRNTNANNLPKVDGASLLEVARIYESVCAQLDEGLPVHENTAAELPGLSNDLFSVVGTVLAALVESGLLLREPTGELSRPTARKKRVVKVRRHKAEALLEG